MDTPGSTSTEQDKDGTICDNIDEEAETDNGGGACCSPNSEPIHMTLEEVRNSLSSSSIAKTRSEVPGKRFPFLLKNAASCDKDAEATGALQKKNRRKSFPSLRYQLKNFFSMKKSQSADSSIIPFDIFRKRAINAYNTEGLIYYPDKPDVNPVSQTTNSNQNQECYFSLDMPAQRFRDLGVEMTEGVFIGDRNPPGFVEFSASLERVKDFGWYWGPINGDLAEKLLAVEPDGSFLLRDSSDDKYIFSLTFKFHDMVRHVRIEHDQGKFSFGSFQKFTSTTIVDFIENAVEHSRSGRYLFFLHRRPILGPLRVQLLHPVSRFRYVQSLRHLCRCKVLKMVRRDLIEDLPLPPAMKEYLGSPMYMFEHVNEYLENRKRDNFAVPFEPDPTPQTSERPRRDQPGYIFEGNDERLLSYEFEQFPPVMRTRDVASSSSQQSTGDDTGSPSQRTDSGAGENP